MIMIIDRSYIEIFVWLIIRDNIPSSLRSSSLTCFLDRSDRENNFSIKVPSHVL